jgi:hypothetical protein
MAELRQPSLPVAASHALLAAIMISHHDQPCGAVKRIADTPTAQQCTAAQRLMLSITTAHHVTQAIMMIK